MLVLKISQIEDDKDKSFIIDLYKNYYGLVRKTIFNITHDYKDIEDLINDSFIKLIEKISLIKTFNKFKLTAYIVYTSRSVAINFIKHRDIQKKHMYFGGETDLVEEFFDNIEEVEEKIIYQQQIDTLSNAILKLNQNQRDVLYFKYILEKDDEEIAKTFGIARDSVRQYLTRARRKAKKLMEKEMSNYA